MGKRKRIRTSGAPRLARSKENGELSPFWWVKWSEEGRSRRRSTGIAVADDPQQSEAKTWLADWNAARGQASQTDPVFDDVIDAYLANRENAGIQSPETLRFHFVVIRERLGRTRISALTDEAIREFIDYLKNPGDALPAPIKGGVQPKKKAPPRRPRRPAAQGTINKKIRCIRQALEFGRRKKLYTVPKPDIDKVARGATRKRFLSKAEGKRLLDAAHSPATAPHVRLFVYLALGAAQRMSAILELTWDQVDFEHGIIWFTPGESQNKNRVVAPMSAGVRAELLAAKQNARTDRVIEYRDGGIEDIGHGFERLVARAGLKDVRIHDLRRTAASWAIMDGASFAEVGALLGDDEKVVKAHYGHFHPSFLKSTTDRIDPALART